jgi:hypothetical protein
LNSLAKKIQISHPECGLGFSISDGSLEKGGKGHDGGGEGEEFHG